jgi:hypothetical protein
MRQLLFLALALAGSSASAQTPPTPNPSPPKSTPQAQPPATQLYRLVPVEQPQYQTVQQPQYQTVQLVQQPAQYQTVQLAPQTVQQVQYVPATQSTFAISNQGSRTVALGPGPIALSLSWVGQRMVGLGKTHVWQINHQIIRPQPQPSPPVQQLVTVSMPQPVVSPPVQVQLISQPAPTPVTQQYRINAPSEDAPPPPVIGQPPAKPSPQSSSIPPPKHLFGWLGN